MSLDPREFPTTGQSGPLRVVIPPGSVAAAEPEVLPETMVHEITEMPKRFPAGARSAVMPALDLVQEHFGSLTPGTMSAVARLLHLDPGYVEGVATFYSLFHLKPIGKHHFYICNNLSCQLRGAEELVAHVRERIGVTENNQVSADGLFSVEPVECLGACEMAPMMRFEHEYHFDITAEYIDGLIADRGGPVHRSDSPTATSPAAAAAKAPGRKGPRGGRHA